MEADEIENAGEKKLSFAVEEGSKSRKRDIEVKIHDVSEDGNDVPETMVAKGSTSSKSQRKSNENKKHQMFDSSRKRVLEDENTTKISKKLAPVSRKR